MSVTRRSVAQPLCHLHLHREVWTLGPPGRGAVEFPDEASPLSIEGPEPVPVLAVDDRDLVLPKALVLHERVPKRLQRLRRRLGQFPHPRELGLHELAHQAIRGVHGGAKRQPALELRHEGLPVLHRGGWAKGVQSSDSDAVRRGELCQLLCVPIRSLSLPLQQDDVRQVVPSALDGLHGGEGPGDAAQPGAAHEEPGEAKGPEDVRQGGAAGPGGERAAGDLHQEQAVPARGAQGPEEGFVLAPYRRHDLPVRDDPSLELDGQVRRHRGPPSEQGADPVDGGGVPPRYD
mmetsp:Transcript_8234/g.28267  ORF Transcript_8234/g.28267 Transcript_8234/m.28267 type:complete len:290 (+) Transcript_8234:1302-2171(+)